MNKPSGEQQIIIDIVKNGYNVSVDACAGSGKSTTVLSIAKQLPEKKILQLTYNSALRYEIRSKTKEYGLGNMSVHTYHSLAVGFYHPNAYTDTGMRKIFINDVKLQSYIDIDILVIDEAQDMTLLYYRLLVRFLTEIYEKTNKKIQIVVMGDYKQGLYEFKGADTRFLTQAPFIWNIHPFLSTPYFETRSLKMSYRITNEINLFVNKVMLGEERMMSCRSGPKVSYINCNPLITERIIIHKIKELIENGAKQDDFFILAGSVKGSRIKKLENMLVMNGINCYVPLFETDKMDERVIQGKVGLSTFHSVKGRQRKYVFIMGFDQNYFSFYGRDLDSDICPNTLYVGATRASEELFLCESNNSIIDRPLDFLKMNHREMKNTEYINFIGTPRNLFYEKSKDSDSDSIEDEIQRQNVTPTDLIKFLHEDVLEEITPIVEELFTGCEKGEIFEIPSIIQTNNGLYEEVSDLNGIAIPCMYYDDINRKWNLSDEPVLYSMIHERSLQLEKMDTYIMEAVDCVDVNMLSVEDYLHASNVYKAIDEQLYSKLHQIKYDECNWLDEEVIENCKDRIQHHIGIECEEEEPQAEYSIIHSSDEEAHENIDMALSDCSLNNFQFRFSARVDLVSEKSVWELKCTNEISLDHKIQVIIYAWLWNILENPEKTFKILNIKTDELFILKNDMVLIDKVVKLVISSKFIKNDVRNNDEFIKMCIE